jgi:hypothetical protein
MKIQLQRVKYIPKELKQGILYVSKEFSIAVHLCACGCGSKVRTPLGPTEWSIEQTGSGPSLSPSVGNWQESCQTHYWIHRGEIRWEEQWTPEQISTGRRREEQRRAAYYDARSPSPKEILHRFWRRVRGLFSRL